MSKQRHRRTVSPSQIQRNGHVSILIRKYLSAKGISVAELNVILGLDKASSTVYNWLGGFTAPNQTMRPKLASVLGVSESQLIPQKSKVMIRETISEKVPTVTLPVATSIKSTTPDLLQFVVTGDGKARIRLDVTTTLEVATNLLQVLLNSGVTKEMEANG